jgi:chloride channel protein, CIC family
MLRSHSETSIPVSTSLAPSLEVPPLQPKTARDKKRLFRISVLSVLVAVAISFIAKLLVYLIDLVTNIFFHQTLSVHYISPATNTLGIFVIFIPVIGGVLVGLMALYGSKAIRGHGIPEAMEQILMNQSRIKPSITFLKPLSAAISIGTGGPFGAEGPIIATGGALGSTIGQYLKITPNERKVILTAGATAGMSAIFGSPIAAIFLAIELLLFEFAPRSIIPVALACITGAAGHHFLFETGPVFPMPALEAPGNVALALYSVLGLCIGVLSAMVTKIVYLIEDYFEKLPIHWMWWPALGGLAVGIIGYFAPRTLGVGYENITDILSGNMPMQLIFSLCVLKFLSWAISLGSGTSGGTLAPLLTIGGATGALLGSAVLYFFPESGITIPLAALVGMAAMFAGASRALLTSIIFALETTSQSHALLPLLAACTGSYFVSFFLMENTIMTEKIARRGVKTPDSYEPDILDKLTVKELIKEDGLVLSSDNSISDVREWLKTNNLVTSHYFLMVDPQGIFKGVISLPDIYNIKSDANLPIETLIKQVPVSIPNNYTLREAVATMSRENVDVLPVVSGKDKNKLVGILSYKDILAAYRQHYNQNTSAMANLSFKRQSIKVLIRGHRLLPIRKKKHDTGS